MKKITSIAPGKVIITGEHSVVYGEQALIGAVSLFVESEFVVGGDEVRVGFENFSTKVSYKIDELRSFWREAVDVWGVFSQTKDDSGIREFQQNKHSVVKLSLGQFYDELGVCEGVDLKVSSNIPVSSGLGSSASVAVSILGGLNEIFNIGWNKEDLNDRVYLVEKIIHGNPSGGDNSTVVFGGLLKFKKVNGEPVFKKIKSGRNTREIYLIQTGKPKESTGEMVHYVSGEIKKSSKSKLISDLGKVSSKIIDSISKKLNTELIKENNDLLNELGVVSKRAREVIDRIEDVGGAAKVCGAGGIKQGSGIVMVFHDDKDAIEYLFSDFNLPNYKVNVGINGWQIK
ncbi:mevalonate kinase [Patescibacteria group bacterium]